MLIDPPPILLEIKNLSVDFIQNKEKIKVLKNVNFNIPSGKIVGVIGESGSGKSVTALSIMGLLQQPPAIIDDNSEILFYARKEKVVNLLKLNPKEINAYRGKHISMIFQEPMTSLNPVMKCGEQVAEIILKHNPDNIKTSKKALHKTLDLFNEVELPRPEIMFNSYPHQISGGQKQRVMIAIAIACKPDLIIADEPTTALDLTIQKTILELLKKLQIKYGMSVLFITHDLTIVSNIADKIIVMNKGSVIEEGSTEQIFNNPTSPYTKGLLACRPPLDKRLLSLPTISDFIDNNNVNNKNIFSEITITERKLNQQILYANPPILKVENLNKSFPVKQKLFNYNRKFVKAVDNVSFEVYPGETLGLVGESGCGKTTLGRSIIRLIEPDKGTIFYKDKNINELSFSEMRTVRKKLQMVFQDPYSSLNPRLVIGKAIIEPMQVHKLFYYYDQQKKRAIDLLEMVGLSSRYFNRYPHEFSGGQRQRICIARSLALNPELIICDESVSALDVSVQAQILNLLNDLKKHFGFTYIFISHDLSVVRYMSDRMAVMKQGKIIEIGDADEIFTTPATEYTKRLLNAIPQVNYRL